MANHLSTKKSIRKTLAKSAINRNRKSRINTYLKRVRVLVQSKSIDEANKALSEAHSEIMKGVQSNVFKKNTASRKIKNLNKHIKDIVTLGENK